ncbi:MAG TPA: hypothetical protein VMT20_08885 [Terriglobia bacterium]|nr:hypothetical protein [Terriglobia bacterium]
MVRASQAASVAIRFLLFVAASFLLVSGARAQEIRRVAEPNQAVRMTHNGYVCAGTLTVTPIDDTYDTVMCSGPVFAASDYEAVYQKRAYDELVKINEARVDVLNHDLKAAIERQFSELPRDMQHLAAIQNLKRSLNEYVDQRLPAGATQVSPPGGHSASTRDSRPGSSPTGP